MFHSNVVLVLVVIAGLCLMGESGVIGLEKALQSYEGDRMFACYFDIEMLFSCVGYIFQDQTSHLNWIAINSVMIWTFFVNFLFVSSSLRIVTINRVVRRRCIKMEHSCKVLFWSMKNSFHQVYFVYPIWRF